MSVLVMHDGSVVAVVGWRSRFMSLFVGCSLLFVALLAVLLFCFWCCRFALFWYGGQCPGVVRFALVFLCLIVAWRASPYE